MDRLRMSIASERAAVETVLEDVSVLNDVAASLPESDGRVRRLHAFASRRLSEAPPIRPRIAAELLGVSEPTVRKWVESQLLQPRSTSPRLLLEPESVFRVREVIETLRAAGRARNLTDAVYNMLVDEQVRSEPDLVASLEQMRKGEYTVRQPSSLPE
jgi:hypothetical protein